MAREDSIADLSYLPVTRATLLRSDLIMLDKTRTYLTLSVPGVNFMTVDKSRVSHIPSQPKNLWTNLNGFSDWTVQWPGNPFWLVSKNICFRLIFYFKKLCRGPKGLSRSNYTRADRSKPESTTGSLWKPNSITLS